MLLSYWLMVIYCLDGSGGGMCQSTVNLVESAAVKFSKARRELSVEQCGRVL
jgi:hypothetical protein